MGQLTGIAILENGLPAQGVSITFSQPKIGGEPTKETIEVDSSGVFTLDADVPADLIARVKIDDEERLLTPIETGPDGAIVFMLPTNTAIVDSEFKRVTTAVTAEIGEGVGLGTLKEQGDRRDLTLLHKKTGWDTRVLALSALAGRVVQEPTAAGNVIGISNEAAYGMLRAGLPTDPEALATIHPETIAQVLEAANDAGIIQMGTAQRAAEVKTFATFRSEELLAAKPGAGASTVQQLINSAPKGKTLAEGKTERDLFKDLITESWIRGPKWNIWDKATEQGLTEETVKALKLHGYLAFLTLNNASLIDQVKDKFSGFDTFVDDLVSNEFDERETWEKALRDLGAEPAMPETFVNAEDPVAAYAGEIVRRVLVSFPTQVVAALVTRGEVKLDDTEEINSQIANTLQEAAGLGFRLGEKNPLDFLREHPQIEIEGDENTIAKVHDGLSTLHRLYQITPNNEMLRLLNKHGIRSAQEVSEYPLDEFLTVMGHHTSSRADVELMHKRAVQVSSMVYTFFSMARQSINAPTTVRTAGAPETTRSQAVDSISKAIPSMGSLFGPLDYCDCDHCGSVLGPAAYLVDILKFLDIDDKIWDGFTSEWKRRHNVDKYPFHKPYDELVRRRPDIVNLKLNCENTSTELPTIDLVNEILEYRLLVNPEGPSTIPDGGVRNSGATLSADVLAEPEFVRDEVYNKVLLEARYPHALPFDLWQATASEFAQWLELPLWQLHKSLIAAPQTSSEPAMLIGCGPVEYKLLSEPEFESVPIRYGYTKDEELAGLSNAQALARRLHVSYVDLTDLLESRFVNPGLDDLGWVLAAGISIASAREWRKDHALAVPERPENDAEVPLWKRLIACRKRLFAIDEAHNLEKGTADNRLRNLPDKAFDDVLLLHNGEALNDFSKTTLITGSGTELSMAKLKKLLLRFDIFVRLQRRLGWTIQELDALLASDPSETDLTAASMKTRVQQVAETLELQTLLPDASRTDLVALIGGVNTLGIDPLYRRLFLTRPLSHRDLAFDAAFGEFLAPDNDGNPLKVGEHLTGLQAGVGLTRLEIETGVASYPTLDVEPSKWAEAALSVDLVSYLYQQAMLARLLNISVTDLVTLRRLSGLSSHSLIDLVELVQQIQSAGLAVPEIANLLDHGTAGPDGTEIRPTPTPELLAACQAVFDARTSHKAKEKQEHDKAAEVVAETDETKKKIAQAELAKLQEELREETEKVADAEHNAHTAILDAVGPSTDLASMLLFGQDPWPSEQGSLVERYLPSDARSSEDINASLRTVHVFLAKTLFLAGRLGLTAPEIQQLNLVSILDASTDPENPTAVSAKVNERFAKLREVLTYCKLRRTVGADSPEFIDVLTASDFAARLAEISNRTTAEIRAAAQELNIAVDPPITVPDLERICELSAWSARIGVSPATLHHWVKTMSTPDLDNGATQRQTVAKQIKDAARAHLGARWNQVAAPISDRLRQRQRDALVAVCVHRTEGIDTVEQLFEDILIDPGSEPVLQTSRIRQAISAVQLFVQRVLLNLERKVHPSSIKATQWEWMKRYRMWEANRKIFLFPENWLEPEFRDDKSHLFTELESTLLQSDVTNDTAEDALLVYLQQLDEIARLDIVTTYVQQDYLDPSSNTLHVIGRTFATPHRYFYRRMTHGIWTAWEPIDLDITGDHLVLAHWRDRLYLFWVTYFLKKEEPKGAPSASTSKKNLTETSLAELRTAVGGEPSTTIQVQLHWSQYVKGSWSPTSASGFFNIYNASGKQADQLEIHSVVTTQDTVQIHLNGPLTMRFELQGRNSPVQFTANTAAAHPTSPYNIDRRGALNVRFAPVLTSVNGGEAKGVENLATVFAGPGAARSLVHPANSLNIVGLGIGPLISPFFVKDTKRTFFVQPYLREDTIEESVESWTMVETSPPPPTDGEKPSRFEIPLIPQLPLGRYPEIVEKIVDVRRKFDPVINPNTMLSFDDVLVGSVGTLSAPDFRSVIDTVGELRVVTPAVDVTGSSHLETSVASGLGTRITDSGGLQLHDVVSVDHSVLRSTGLTSEGAVVVQGRHGVFDRQQLSGYRFITR